MQGATAVDVRYSQVSRVVRGQLTHQARSIAIVGK
jgi:hypothetical protein